jgi:uncharacterized protein YbbC (DUF1343 family)
MHRQPLLKKWVIPALTGAVVSGSALACGGSAGRAAVESTDVAARAAVQPGITVLLGDSLALIRGKRIALLTNQTGVDAAGASDIDLLRGPAAKAANVQLMKLFSPEHGIRGTEDREGLESGIDARSGLAVHSLYTNGTIAPPDSLLDDVDALVFDLQDIGTRTWTYVGAMVYAMRTSARRHLPLIVLDRPDPIDGVHVDGPMLDTALANPENPTPQRPGKAYALYPFPLRHGMTMGELALFYNETLGIHAPLTVVPMRGWRRAMWFDQTGLPWVRPSPNLPTLTSALVYPSLVAFEGTNVSVGRGTADAFQRFGAPWMDATTLAERLNGRRLPGVRFVVDSFTPHAAGDGKYNDRRIPGIRVDVVDRDAVQSGRISAAILWAFVTVHKDSFHLTPRTFDERFGNAATREAIVRGMDPDTALARHQPQVDTFLSRAERFRLYR